MFQGSFSSPTVTCLIKCCRLDAGSGCTINIFCYFLKSYSTFSGGLLYWEREKKPAAEIFPSFYSRASSAEIEITSYVLLASIRQSKLSREQLVDASQMAQWLVRQQNYHGGFSSTQVTFINSRYVVRRITNSAVNFLASFFL